MMTLKHNGYALTGMVALAAAPAHASSLPQMDPTWYVNQLFWLAISFGILYVFVARFVSPAIAQVLKVRAAAIDDAILEAERARSAAESTRGDAASASLSARATAAEMMAKVQAENAAEAAAAIAKLDHELERRASQAAAVLEESVKKARTGMNDAVQSLAESMAARLLDSSPAEGTPALKLVAKR